MLDAVGIDDHPGIAINVDSRDRRIMNSPVGRPMSRIVLGVARHAGVLVNQLIYQIAVDYQCDVIVGPTVMFGNKVDNPANAHEKDIVAFVRSIVPTAITQGLG